MVPSFPPDALPAGAKRRRVLMEAEMRVQFVRKDNGPERLACDAEIHFDEGPLAGMKLVGFSVWRTPEGELSVTFPSRAYGTGTERRFFDYLRPADAAGAGAGAKKVKAWIIEQYRAEMAA
jgi:hypothetical protein